MKRGIILELRPKGESFDFSKIMLDAANGQPVDLSDCELSQHVAIAVDFRAEFVEHIARHGLSSLMREPLLEALVARGTNPSAVLPLLHAFLNVLTVTTDFVIVDPYFFAPTTDAAYPQFVEQVLRPVLPTLQNLSIVTLANKPKQKKVVDPALAVAITSALAASAPNLNVAHKTSNAFHDRFWIDPVSSPWWPPKLPHPWPPQIPPP